MKQVIALAAAAVLVAAAPAIAQETTTGSIAGQVVDAQGLPIPGATVVVSSARGEQTHVTDDQGRFFAPFLTPGTYTVRVELQGFAPIERQNVVVRLGQRVDLTDLTLKVGAVAEVVEVTGRTPVIDTRTTTVGATIDEDLLDRVPVGRSFADTLFIAPGVSSGGGTGRSNPSISGGSGLENQYVVDGINITNAGYGALGSYSIVFGSLGTGLPFDFMQEVQVKTAGFEAEFGQATGGVTNVITKSGTNEFSGTLFGYVQPSALEGDWEQIQTVNGTVNTTETQLSDGGAEVGGPILQDRLFFFGAIDPQFQRRTLIAPPDFPLAELGEVDRERQIVAYAAKASYQVASGHRLTASFFGDPSSGDEGPQRNTALLRTDTASFSELEEFGGHNQTVRYEAIMGANWLLEASFARASNSLVERPSVDEWSVTDETVVPQVRSGGIGFFEVGNEGENLQYQAKSTHIFNTGAAGEHQLRYGILYEDIDYDNTIDRTGPTFTLPDGTQTATGAQIDILPDPRFGRIFRVSRANITNVRQSRQNYLSLFVQDTWRIGDRVTIKPGLRWDRQELIGNLAEFTWDENFAPRIGATFDPTGTGRAKIFGSYGRFYAKIPNDLAVRALSADASVTRADYFDADLTQPVPEGVLAAQTTQHFITSGLSASDIDPDSNSTSQEEWLVGTEYELVEDLSVGVRYIRRRFVDILEDTGNVSATLFFTNPELAGNSVEFFITNPDTGIPPTVAGVGAFEEPIHDYDAIEITANKRFSENWAVQASYSWARLEGTFEGFFRNDNGQSDPAITSLYDFPTNDPTYAAIGVPEFGFRGDIRFLGEAGAGPLPNDRRHQVKVFGNYTFNMGLNLGVGFSASPGTPLTAMAAHPVYTNAGEIPEGPRGSGIPTVDGFKERGEPNVTFDLHADYAIPLGNQQLVLLADVFNLLDTQNALIYDYTTETSFLTPNPDFGQPVDPNTQLPGFQVPRQVRLGARFVF